MREEIIEDINRALDAGAHLSALALAIAIPDFCGSNDKVSSSLTK